MSDGGGRTRGVGRAEVDEMRMESWLQGWCAGAGHTFLAFTRTGEHRYELLVRPKGVAGGHAQRATLAFTVDPFKTATVALLPRQDAP